MRLFIAIPFPEPVRAALREAQDRLRAQGVRANYTRPENLHLTLAFLGETDRVRDVQRAMATAARPAFSMTVGGSGAFGDLYWAGVRRNPALTALASALGDALRAASFPIDRRPFRPHVTLARRVDAPQPPRLEVPDISMDVTRMVLMRSDRQAGRLVYTPISETELASAEK